MTLRTSCWLLRLKLSRVKLYFRFACETEDFVIWNFCFCSLSKGIFNALKRYCVWLWNTLTVINVRSCLLRQKQWWNFLRGKKKLKLSLIVIVRFKGQGIFNRAAMGRARFMVYPWFIIIFFNRAAMGRARFMVYPWFIFLTAQPQACAVYGLPSVY